jgi:hypothetical protein
MPCAAPPRIFRPLFQRPPRFLPSVPLLSRPRRSRAALSCLCGWVAQKVYLFRESDHLSSIPVKLGALWSMHHAWPSGALTRIKDVRCEAGRVQLTVYRSTEEA